MKTRKRPTTKELQAKAAALPGIAVTWAPANQAPANQAWAITWGDGLLLRVISDPFEVEDYLDELDGRDGIGQFGRAS